ncbi:MAG: hypothetical protein A2622_01845 [Bdellovibrionales bacterium RIFCSPHIGHO2_01_FULL_40_29]|nr:MAG: hypothetical protein A2622_01845 [Bdellovibrionales bacterium RIFCSPHIGHO2_01_FULL_40_29]OFZ33834.1 MAG: hypothetical protein A3D17_02265 [Bdellovibrionales bacterium RIFCSPHIGHO2_02_FULL_40_15]
MKQIFLAALVSVFAGSVAVAGPGMMGMGDMNMTKEERETAAKHHEAMAVCLRSDKTMEVCHDEMRAACGDNEKGCMMMGKSSKKMMKKTKDSK